MRLRRIVVVASALVSLPLAILAAYVWWMGLESDQPSVCRGDTVGGSLHRGKRLPYSGENYRAYSLLGHVVGRTFVHSSVRDAMRDAYAELSKSQPDSRFVYGESGWPQGGRFWPHRSHANGTSVDFFVPVRTMDDRVSELPTWPHNLFGYAVHFDSNARSGSRRIDFETMGQHLLALDRAARKNGIGIRRVIFDVNLQPRLAGTKSGSAAMQRMAFNKQQAWVRHDDHYHIDFAVPCR
jgi:penicillin-insensitive murein DD-endopeptidase